MAKLNNQDNNDFKRLVYFPNSDKVNIPCYEFCPYAGNGCDMIYSEDCPKYMDYVRRTTEKSRSRFGQYYQDREYYQ